MVSLLPTKIHEILFSSFRGVALTNCVTDRRTDRQMDRRTDRQTGADTDTDTCTDIDTGKTGKGTQAH